MFDTVNETLNLSGKDDRREGGSDESDEYPGAKLAS